MKRINFTFGITPEMEPYFQKVIDENRASFREIGVPMTEQDIIDIILFDALKKECEKFGYKG